MNRLLPLLAGLVLASTAWAEGEPSTAPATYRLDYFHTGGPQTEIFAVDRLRREPLPWPGNVDKPADDGQSGVYRYEVRDAAGNVLQARGYASVFGEWMSTDEARERHRTFHESVRFPAPAKPGVVTVKIFKRDAQQVFQPVWETQLDTTDMFVDQAPAPALAPVAVETHGPARDKVDLLLIGDGY
ncbi:MAG TPA: peptidase M64 N-terminal domain-containing protein, partial [Steroidobacteraceae bacterium]|nr:peptidase M64 N-terminal domain-containing protein [Steroidobacteraceae bacterium]